MARLCGKYGVGKQVSEQRSDRSDSTDLFLQSIECRYYACFFVFGGMKHAPYLRIYWLVYHVHSLVAACPFRMAGWLADGWMGGWMDGRN
jgi:hypothetical protein